LTVTDQPEKRGGQPTTTSVCAAGVSLTGASVSAYKTFICTRDLNLILDIGDVTEEMLSIDNVLVTHGHQDHLLGLTRYVGLRRLQHMAPPKVIVPARMVDPIIHLFHAWQDLEGFGRRRDPELDLVAAQPGDEIPLDARRLAIPFPVDHSAPSLGYTVVERTPHLLPEFHGFEGHRLAELKKQGVEITSPTDKVLLRYVGDTLPTTFPRLRELPESPVTIIECTFLFTEHFALAEQRGHLHIQHIIDNLDAFGAGEIVLTHFSRRYGRGEVERFVRSRWPQDDQQRLHLIV
jgi:ribonuclease Z